MIKLTQSLHEFMLRFYREEWVYLTFGKTSVLTPKIWNEYLDWCRTDEGRKYLKGGELYKPEENEFGEPGNEES